MDDFRIETGTKKQNAESKAKNGFPPSEIGMGFKRI